MGEPHPRKKAHFMRVSRIENWPNDTKVLSVDRSMRQTCRLQVFIGVAGH